mgnify:FL=1
MPQIQIPRELPASIVRNLVPLITVWILTNAPAWLGLTDDQVSAAVAFGLGTAWTVLARIIEMYVSPRFGQVVLGLGLYGAPSYEGRHEADPS